MSSLTNTKIKDTYPALLKASDNGVIGATEKVITDGLGNDSVLKLGTASASFTSDIEVNTLTIGLGSGSIATNTALGLDALLSNTTGSGNVSVGQGSLRANTTGSTNVAVGKDSLRANTTGGSNTALGYFALYDNTNGESNVAVGRDALNANTTGSNTVAIGRGSMSDATSGNDNTAVGFYSLVNNEASKNTAIGHFAMLNNTTGSFNVAVGSSSLEDNIDGADNVAVGYSSLSSNTSGSQNIAVGRQALSSNTTGGNNTAVGHSSLVGNITGINNTAVGRSSLFANTGSNNTAVGAYALLDNTTGTSNTAVGYLALSENTTGGYNTAVGSLTLEDNTTGSRNTAVGFNALDSNTEGSDNTAIGHGALDGNTTGDKNTAVGRAALLRVSTGFQNTALGFEAADDITTGSNNVHIGYQATASSATVSNEIVIGSGATGNGSNTATYGNSSITDHYFTSGTVRINSDSLRLTGATNPQVLVTDTTNSVSVGLQALDASTKIESTHSFKTSIANNIIHSVTSSGVEITGNLAVDTNTLYVDAANNRVGVGTSSPAVPLHTVGESLFEGRLQITSATPEILFSVPSGGLDSRIYNDGSGNFIFGTGTNSSTPTERMRIDSSGNVGINCNPSEKLEVNGNIKVSSNSGTTFTQISDTSTGGKQWSLISAGAGNAHSVSAGNFYLRNSTDGVNAFVVDSSGNVGIGTVPSYNLHNTGSFGFATNITGNIGVFGSNTATADTYFRLQNSAGAYDVGTSATGHYLYGQGSLPLQFFTNATERMRIDSSGNVGIGTQTINATYSPKLEIASTASDGTGGLLIGSYLPTLTFYDYSGGATIGQIQQDGTGLVFKNNGSERMRIDSSGNVGIGRVPSEKLDIEGASPFIRLSNTDETESGIVFVDSASAAQSAKITYDSGASNALIFYNNAAAERMRITSGGDVYIAGADGSGAAGFAIYSSGAMEVARANNIVAYFNRTGTDGDVLQFRNDGTAVGSISVTSLFTAYNTSSDYRLKENVVEMTGALDRVDALKPSRFNFIAHPEKTVDGFLAHEVQAIVPEAVTGEKDAVDEEGNPIYQGIDQSKIVPLLVGAIKELKAEIELLKSQLS